MAFDLPTNRLATTDEQGKRVYLYPADVSGGYKERKWKIHLGLMLFFLILPWIYIDGRQLLLLDVVHREFFFFGLHFRSHDAPLIVFLFLVFAFLIGFITAVWGRIWCGWACPQTVFTELIFRRIERWAEGSHRERKLLDESAWTTHKIRKKIIKYGLFTLASLIITHSFLAYFVGSRELLKMVSSSPIEHWDSFLIILGTTTIILFDFGWFREQFCTIMCPYGRFQSVMLGAHSLVIAYDSKRGEPRREVQHLDQAQGDCVNCYRCVQVCPTGIDIRRGLQMECVGCTACIDACDEVMSKVKKPKGLIRYTTLAELAGKVHSYATPQALAFGILFLISISALGITLSQKEFLDAMVLRAAGSPYEIIPQQNAEPLIINHFHLELSNQTKQEQTISFILEQSGFSEQIKFIMPMNPIKLQEGASRRADFFLNFPKAILEHGSKKLKLRMKTQDSEQLMEITIVGPDA